MAFPGWDGWTGHVHVSEREVAHRWPDGRWDDARWEDCLWVAAVEYAVACGHPVVATHAEAEALRAASGDSVTGGSNLGDLTKGMQARYGWSGPKEWGFQAAWQALIPGTAAVATGSMGNFPAGHRLRRWDPDFASGHAVMVMRLDGSDQAWWCDGLAPAGTYQGEWVTRGELAQFMGSGTTWGVMVGAIQGRARRDNEVAILYDLQRWKVPQGTPFYDAPGGDQVSTFSVGATVTTLGTPMDRTRDGTPFRNDAWRAALVSTRAIDGVTARKVVYIRTPPAAAQVPTDATWDATALKSLLDPTWTGNVSGFTQADLDAAKAAGLAEGKAEIAEASRAAGKAAESARWTGWVATHPK